MKQRPIACLALFVFLILNVIPAGFFYEPRQVADKCEAQITGGSDAIQKKKTVCSWNCRTVKSGPDRQTSGRTHY